MFLCLESENMGQHETFGQAILEQTLDWRGMNIVKVSNPSYSVNSELLLYLSSMIPGTTTFAESEGLEQRLPADLDCDLSETFQGNNK